VHGWHRPIENATSELTIGAPQADGVSSAITDLDGNLLGAAEVQP
jgi:hypothetical protein